jgi:ABC-2 type transport system permease protein
VTAAQTVWLVTRRELREGVRGRTFLVSTALSVLLLVGVIALSAIFGNKNEVHLGVAGTVPARLVASLDAAAKPLDAHVRLNRYANAASARDAVAHRKVEAAFAAGGRRLLVRSDSSATALAVATSAARAAFLPEQARRLGIDPAQARALLAPPVTVAHVAAAAGAGSGDRTFALVATILLFLAVSIYGQSVLMSVVQEKVSRIVEVLIATIRPRHLLAGKVAGIGLLGLTQIVLLGIGAVAAAIGGVIALPSLGLVAGLALVSFLLGFVLYAVAFAAAGALVSRIEDASGAAAPVSLTMVACYLASFGALSNPDGPLATVLSMLPVSAPFTLPARAAQTAIPAWQYAVSLLLMLAAIWALVRAAGRIYELGLLRTGPRVPFREAIAGLRSRRARYAAAAR